MTPPDSHVVHTSIVGCVGLPAKYGGFETLAANLVAYCDENNLSCSLTVYCSAKAYPNRAEYYGGTRLRYVPLDANGPSSIIYDIVSIMLSVLRGDRVILVLGVSGAIILPLIRIISRARIVVNIDGLEWKRPKWSRLAARFLKISEAIAVRFAHVVVADNQGIVDHVSATYGREAINIPYGGDHAVLLSTLENSGDRPPEGYALMLCRIEPENHIHIILEAFAAGHGFKLIAVGNWNSSEYGRKLRDRYQDHPSISILDPVFDKEHLYRLRANAALYVHGHSAGGTNPALVEMMHFAIPVAAFDCNYNRYTTENSATYFKNAVDLAGIVAKFVPQENISQGETMRAIAQKYYTWKIVGHKYFKAMGVIGLHSKNH